MGTGEMGRVPGGLAMGPKPALPPVSMKRASPCRELETVVQVQIKAKSKAKARTRAKWGSHRHLCPPLGPGEPRGSSSSLGQGSHADPREPQGSSPHANNTTHKQQHNTTQHDMIDLK